MADRSRRTKRIRRIAIGLTVGVLAMLAGLTPVSAQTVGTVDVTQEEICDGGWVQITGTGWPASTFVHLRGDGEPLGGAATNASGVITGVNGTPGVWRTMPAGTTPPNNYATVTAYTPQSPGPEDMVHTFVLVLDC